MSLFVRSSSLASILIAGMLLTGCSSGENITIDNVDIPTPLPEGIDFTPELNNVPAVEECVDGDFNRTASYKPKDTDDVAAARAALVDDTQISIGVSQTTNLMGYRDVATGQLSGFDIDIAKEIATAILGEDANIHWVPMTSGEREEALASGQVDMVVRTMTMTCDRWKNVEFSSEYLHATQRLLVNKNSGIESLEDLTEEHRVCSSAGSTSLPQILESTPAAAVTLDDLNDCVALLQNGVVDAFTTDDTILAGMASQDPNLVVVGEALAEEPYGIAIAKDNLELVGFVNATLEDMRKDGTWDSIYGQWLEPALGEAEAPQAKYRD